ncbi:40S ribosomal protein S17.e.B [Rhodotorula kratochvilovae]
MDARTWLHEEGFSASAASRSHPGPRRPPAPPALLLLVRLSKAEPLSQINMGRVRTKTVKRASRVVIEKYYPRLTLDFHTNKKICDEVAIIPSKRLRNKIAGFTTHLMKRIQKGPVRGISFKLQEEERERKDNYVPEVSALDTQGVPIDVDPETKDLLKSLGFDGLPVNVVAPSTSFDRPGRRNVVGLGRRD